MGTIRLRMLREGLAFCTIEPGSVVRLQDRLARVWIHRGIAEPLDEGETAAALELDGEPAEPKPRRRTRGKG